MLCAICMTRILRPQASCRWGVMAAACPGSARRCRPRSFQPTGAFSRPPLLRKRPRRAPPLPPRLASQPIRSESVRQARTGIAGAALILRLLPACGAALMYGRSPCKRTRPEPLSPPAALLRARRAGTSWLGACCCAAPRCRKNSRALCRRTTRRAAGGASCRRRGAAQSSPAWCT